jgi:hypothetical protein
MRCAGANTRQAYVSAGMPAHQAEPVSAKIEGQARTIGYHHAMRDVLRRRSGRIALTLPRLLPHLRQLGP